MKQRRGDDGCWYKMIQGFTVYATALTLLAKLHTFKSKGTKISVSDFHKIAYNTITFTYMQTTKVVDANETTSLEKIV